MTALPRLTLCALYFAQGVPWGFTTIAIPAYLGARGMAPEAIGVALATTVLPYSFKWVWGPLIDTLASARFGRRRPWIVVAQLLMAASLLAMLSIQDVVVDRQRLIWLLFTHTCFAALQDVAVDALAIDLLDEHERGRANGLMGAARCAGGILGGAGMSWFIARTSLASAFVLQASVVLALTAIPLVVRERRDGEGRPHIARVMRSLAIAFSMRSSIVVAILMLVLTIPIGLVSANAFALFTQRLGWTADEYGRLTGGIALGVGFVASLAGGQLADRLGHRRAMALASLALASGWIAFGLSSAWWSSTAFVYAFALFEQLCFSALLVCIFALCMDVSWRVAAATQFTVYIAMSNFSGALGYRAAGAAYDAFGYAGCYLFAASIQIAVTLLIALIGPIQTVHDGRVPPRGIVAIAALAGVLALSTGYVLYGLL